MAFSHLVSLLSMALLLPLPLLFSSSSIAEASHVAIRGDQTISNLPFCQLTCADRHGSVSAPCLIILIFEGGLFQVHADKCTRVTFCSLSCVGLAQGPSSPRSGLGSPEFIGGIGVFDEL